MKSRDCRSKAVLAVVLAIALALIARPAWAAKNVIIMVADGAGFNTWNATSMYQGKLGKQVYDGQQWVKLACSTFPLSQAKKPTGNETQDRALAYSPLKAWNTTIQSLPTPQVDKGGKDEKDDNEKEEELKALKVHPLFSGRTKPFAGYVFLDAAYTDSAAAATALATGVKTYNNAINWSNLNQPLRGRTIAEIAKSAGKSVGAITTVPWSHATPACLGGAHSKTRNDYIGIAKEMLSAPYLDVIMGAGHPDYTDDGAPRASSAKKEYKYVGGEKTWDQLKSGAHPGAWKLIETKAAFEALATGDTPRKILGTAQVATTLQQKRSSKPAGAAKESSAAKSSTDASEKSTEKAAEKGAEKVVEKPPEKPFTRPFNRNVPNLATMTRGTLNCLGKNPKGFYLMIEGGAVDWANHSRQSGRMIEEQIDFLDAVEAVVQWIEKNSSWDETLLILTADHETGLLWGPHSDTVAFDPIVNRGKGSVPDMRYNSNRHSNSLVPLYACGAGSEGFARSVVGVDETAVAKYGISGRYVDNTSVFIVMKSAVTAAAQKARPAAVPAR